MDYKTETFSAKSTAHGYFKLSASALIIILVLCWKSAKSFVFVFSKENNQFEPCLKFYSSCVSLEISLFFFIAAKQGYSFRIFYGRRTSSLASK